MTDGVFQSIADSYQRGTLDNDLDAVFSVAASSGIVLLPGIERRFVEAKGGAFEVVDLLLPVDLVTWKTLTAAKRAGINIFPTWFTYNSEKGYFEFTQEELCRQFIRAHQLTRHKGAFVVNGAAVSDDSVKEALRRVLAIVRKDAGSYVNGAFAALKVMCKDDAPGPKRDTIKIESLKSEMEARGYIVRYNVVSGEYETSGRTEAGRKMTQDDLVTLLHNALADEYKGVSFETLYQYVSYCGRENQYNPVIKLLSETEWDGLDRLPQLYSIVGATDDDLSKTLIRKWLYQAVALLFNDASDPFGADGCLVLNGEQGAGKTSLFRHLALRDEWFGEGCSIDDHDKDTGRRVITKWISELGEVESTLKSDISKLKAFVSASIDRYRLPYGKADIVSPRLTSLCATCNSDRYLIDPTGNRRWWSVPFTRIVPRDELVGLDALQLWAQIYSVVAPLEYRDKAACFRLTEEERKQLAIRNGEYEKPLKGQPEVEDILTIAARDELKRKKMTVSEFKNLWEVLRPYSAQQISASLKACGIVISKTKAGMCAELPLPYSVSIG